MARQPTENRRNTRPALAEPTPAPAQANIPLRGNPANENDPSTAMMMRRLRRAPSYDVMWIALVLAAAWAVGWFLVYKDALTGNLAITPTAFLQAIALLVLPCIGLVTVAYFLWRAQQLRQVSEVLMQQAMRLINPRDIATEGLTSIAQSVRQEVDMLVGGVEQALQRASALEEIVHKEVSAVERAFGSNEERIRNLVNGLETQRAALQQTSSQVASEAQPMLQRLEANTQGLNQVVSTALTTFGRIEDGLKNSSADLSRTIDDVSQRTAETTNAIGHQSEQFERISSMLLSDFRGFSGELQSHMQTLNSTATTLGTETRKFSSELQGLEQNLVGLMRQNSDVMASTHAEYSQNLMRVSEGVTNQLRTVHADSANHLQNVHTESAGQLRAIHSDTASLLQNVHKESADQLRAIQVDSANHLQNIHAQSAGQLRAIQAESANHLQNIHAESAGQLQRTHAEAAANLDRTHTLIQTGLQGLTGDFVRQLEAARGEIKGQFDESAGRMISELDGLNLRFHERFSETSSRLFNQVEHNNNELVTQLSASGSGVIGAIRQSADDYAKALNEAHARHEGLASALQGNLSRTTSLLAQEMQTAGSHVNDTLISTSSTIAAHLKETSDIVSRQMQESGSAIAQNIDVASGGITDKIITISGEFVQKLHGARDGLLTSFLGASGELVTNLEDASATILGRLQHTNNEMSGRLDRVGAELTERMHNTNTTMVKHLDVVSNQIADRLLTANDTVVDKMDRVSADVTERLQSSNAQMISHIDRVGTDIAERLQATGHEMAGQFDSVSADVTDRINLIGSDVTSRLENAGTKVTANLHATGTDMASRIESLSAEMADLMHATSTGLADQLEGSSRQVTTRLAQTAKEIDRNLNEATAHLDGVSSDAAAKFETHGKRFAETLEGSTGRIFTDLGRARDAFAEGLGETALQITGRFEQETGLIVSRIDKAVLEFDGATANSSSKMREASERFAKHMSGAHGLLADQLANAATDIDQRLENVSLQLTGRLESASGKISERLEDVSSLVDKSIDKFNAEMEHMLQSRRDMLDTLATDANRRATEVDKTMSNYMNVIEESLAAAEERARHLGRIVADQSNAALANLEEQLRKLESSSGGQVQQAARALREQHERALSNMNEMLSSTASDFQQTAQDMRITAQQVVKDIDAARGELKRAVVDLPEETRSNADAMRRVVADQISALNALADVVRKQSGSLDYSTPAFATAPRQAAALPRAEVYAPPPPVRVEVVPMAPPVAAPAPAPKLASLAREIESANAKLNVSARDVVEAIEGQLPRDLERRYAGTEKGTYTKRLYDSRSRKLVKALEGRYSDERLLRSRVQAYNRLFEKLLDTISGTDGSDALMEEVLASDQGRIYMMLAEVAGRLPSRG